MKSLYQISMEAEKEDAENNEKEKPATDTDNAEKDKSPSDPEENKENNITTTEDTNTEENKNDDPETSTPDNTSQSSANTSAENNDNKTQDYTPPEQFNVDIAAQEIINNETKEEMDKANQENLDKVIDKISMEDDILQHWVDGLLKEHPEKDIGLRIGVELDTLINNTNDFISMHDDVENIRDSIHRSDENINRIGAEAMLPLIDYFKNKTRTTTKMLGLESCIENRYIQKQRKTIALENFKEWAKNIWQAIIDALKNIGEQIKIFFKWIWDTLTNKKKKAVVTYKLIDKVDKKEKEDTNKQEVDLFEQEFGSIAPEKRKDIHELTKFNAMVLKFMRGFPPDVDINNFTMLTKNNRAMTTNDIHELCSKGFDFLYKELVDHQKECDYIKGSIKELIEDTQSTHEDILQKTMRLPFVLKPSNATGDLSREGVIEVVSKIYPCNYILKRTYLERVDKDIFTDEVKNLKKYLVKEDSQLDMNSKLPFIPMEQCKAMIGYLLKAEDIINKEIKKIEIQVNDGVDDLTKLAKSLQDKYNNPTMVNDANGNPIPLAVKRLIIIYNSQLNIYLKGFISYFSLLLTQLTNYLEFNAVRKDRIIEAVQKTKEYFEKTTIPSS